MEQQTHQTGIPTDLDTSKGRIVFAALRLFASSGYHAVSVRDIAREVGIKDASIYSHFASKDEILATIIERFRLAFKSSIPDESEFELVFKHCDPRSFLRRGFSLLKKRLEDPSMAWSYFVLIREKFDNELASDARYGHRANVVAYVGAAFTYMMEKKLIPECDPVSFAKLYEYPLFLMLEEYVGYLCHGEDTSVIERDMKAHTDFIVSLVMGNCPT